MRTYQQIDLDYDSFPIPDLSLDLHFVHLSAAEHRAQISARHEAEAQARLSELPEDHKVILSPPIPPTPLARPNSGHSSTVPCRRAFGPIPASSLRFSPPFTASSRRIAAG